MCNRTKQLWKKEKNSVSEHIFMPLATKIGGGGVLYFHKLVQKTLKVGHNFEILGLQLCIYLMGRAFKYTKIYDFNLLLKINFYCTI